jgi:Xaa-Pro aminopeptidase
MTVYNQRSLPQRRLFMRIDPLPASEYERRVRALQDELRRENIDVLIGYSSECESATSRYFTGFWPFFDFASVVIPARGEAVLVTGGPESLEFAEAFSSVPVIKVNPLLVETSPPDWVPQVSGETMARIVLDALGKEPKSIGIANWNIFPRTLLDDLGPLAEKADLRPADDLVLRVQAIKSDVEIPYIVEAYRITEHAMRRTLETAKPGMREWELEAVARSEMVTAGAEGMPYPAWVCSGPNTVQSLCRSTSRAVQADELVQFTFGAKYMGYCGNMCRPFAFGSLPGQARKLMEVALEAMGYAIGAIKPGIEASSVFDGYYDILARYGFEDFTLYGPAHGTGHSEVEGLWLAKQAEFTVQPNMLFNVDIWLSDGTYGLRYEDGVLVTESGVRELSGYRREVIVL